jgi:DNA-binding MarR family transcriptional regulator
MAKAILSENAQVILSHLQDMGGELETAPMIAEATGINVKSVNGIATGLAKRGLVTRLEVEGMDKKVIALTDAGREFDPQAIAE